MPSPAVTIQDGAGSPVATTDGVDVLDDGGVVTVQLVDLSAETWTPTITGTDDLVVKPTLTINATTKTATFTKPAGPWALIFQSQVDGGVDVNGDTQQTYTTTFGVYCDAAGQRLMASNERAEGSASFGWSTKFNAFLRALTGAAQAVFGKSAHARATSGIEYITTTNATPTSTSGNAVFALPDNTVVDVVVTVVAKKTGSADRFCQDYRARYYRSGGSATLDGSVITGSNAMATGTLATASATLTTSTNNIVAQVTGVAATNITWSVTMQIQQAQD